MKRASLLAAAALMLTACETATPYQPANAPGDQATGGYSDQQIEPDRWRVTFSGNDLTGRDTVNRYLLFRAAQLTLAQGYDWFQTADRHTDKQSSFVGEQGWGGDWGPQWGLYRRGYGWGYGYWGGAGWGGPWWGGGPVDVEQVSQYRATAEIIMGRGPKPTNGPRAFDAHSVIANLQPTIKYPNTPARG
jgi:hypothetical protein